MAEPTEAPAVVARVEQRPLDPARLLADVAAHGHGATVLFVGTVREQHEGRRVTGIDYAVYAAMAERELAGIVAETEAEVAGARVAVAHRVGFLAVGEVSVVVAATHAHRAPAFDALRYTVEALKRRVPIWKREHYVDGTRAWVDPTAPKEAPGATAAGAEVSG